MTTEGQRLDAWTAAHSEPTPEHAARIEAARAESDALAAHGRQQMLADAIAGGRRRVSEVGLLPNDGDLCTSCGERWCLPAHKAACAHTSICEDCWPNGCPECEREAGEMLDRREAATGRILAAALEIRTQVDDLSDTDLRSLGWIARKDVLQHVDLTFEALRRVRDTLRSEQEKTA